MALPDELRRERQEGDGQQEEVVDEQHRPVDPPDQRDGVVVVHPDDPDREEARHIGEVRRPEVEQLVAEVLGRGDRELEHEQRRGDREHAVAERLEAAGAGLVHGRIVAERGGRLGQSGRELAADQPHGLEVGVEEVLEHHAVAAGALVLAEPRDDLVHRADDAALRVGGEPLVEALLARPAGVELARRARASPRASRRRGSRS